MTLATRPADSVSDRDLDLLDMAAMCGTMLRALAARWREPTREVEVRVEPGMTANADPRLLRSHDVPDLLIVDLKLPRMNGLELLQRMRADPRTRLVPVVVLTSSIEEEDVARCYEAGANSYVRKPVNYDEFVGVARKLGDYWLNVNHVSGGLR